MPFHPACDPATDYSALHVDVFFYSYYQDDELLRARGAAPCNARPACLPGWRLHLAGGSTLVRAASHRTYGTVFSLTHADLRRLYDFPGVGDYVVLPVAVDLVPDACRLPVLCYVLAQGPGAGPVNPVHVERLRQVMRARRLPTVQLDLASAPVQTGGLP